MATSPPSRPNPIRAVVRQRQRRLLTTRAIRDNLVSLAGLIGAPVVNEAAAEIGRMSDIVARWDGEEPYPPVTGLVVRVGRRPAFVSIDQLDSLDRGRVRLQSSRLDLRDFARRPGEVLLARDVLDHQLVDVDGVQVIRAADLYLAYVPGPAGPVLRLVGVDVSGQTLLRRLGPKRWRALPTPERVIDWSAIQPFGGAVPTLRLRASHDGLQRLRPGELADLLEDLGRDARQELLSSLEPETAADALEEMDPEELGALLRETPPAEAANLLARMEPDEAVDALRDLEPPERDELLQHLDAARREELTELLEFKEDRAGGFMTTNLVVTYLGASVNQVRDSLRAEGDHAVDIDAVAVVDDAGLFLGDVRLFDLAIAEPEQLVADLLSATEPVMVGVDAEVAEVADHLTESRQSSVVVVDDEGHPLGRILADDVIDALRPERGRLHFPRLLA
jgi:CBS domain-containing protein